LSRPSEKLGTHSTSVDIREKDSGPLQGLQPAQFVLLSRGALRQPRNPGEAVESCVKAQDSVDAVLLHHGQVYGIARGESRVTKDNFLGSLEDCVVDGQYLIDHAEQGIEGWLNGVVAVDGYIAMQYFLEHFRVGDPALALAQQLLHAPLRVDLMGMGCSNKVHRNVGINQDHEC
jgi:hypothetical protein